MAVSPQPRVAGEAVTNLMGQQMAVKVEGIVQVTSTQTCTIGRRVKAVQVTVTSQSNSASAIGPEGKVRFDLIDSKEYFISFFFLYYSLWS